MRAVILSVHVLRLCAKTVGIRLARILPGHFEMAYANRLDCLIELVANVYCTSALLQGINPARNCPDGIAG